MLEVSDEDVEEYSSNEDMSDLEPIASEDDRNTWSRKFIRSLNKPTFSRARTHSAADPAMLWRYGNNAL